MNDFSSRLKGLRLSVGVSQADLAEKLGLNGAAISKYETGRSTPDIYTLHKIASYFCVSVDYLLGITDSHTPIELSDPLIQKIASLPNNVKERLIGYLDGLDY